MEISSAVHRPLRDKFVSLNVTEKKGSVLSRLLTLIRSHSPQKRSSVGDSALKCTAKFNDQARHFNLLLPQVSSSSALLYYQASTIYSYVFKMSRPLHDIKFTINLAHGDKSIGRYYYMLHGFSNKNLRLPSISITQIHF